MEFVPNILSKISFSSEAIASLFLFLVALFTAVTSLILFFHWKKYGMSGATLALMELIYVVVAVLLLVTAFLNLN